MSSAIEHPAKLVKSAATTISDAAVSFKVLYYLGQLYFFSLVHSSIVSRCKIVCVLANLLFESSNTLSAVRVETLKRSICLKTTFCHRLLLPKLSYIIGIVRFGCYCKQTYLILWNRFENFHCTLSALGLTCF